ncbi:ATP-dependent nuclease [Parapedobacter indicus]|uniref:Predicted ATP-dependent endonuclease of the OLD family, contains P-loop ATPase and TOPRIM domains n=1 Tax=Parapedobacter indicus TaxID=1477437 RepID=A0A1I3IT46_9SPHI|nr:AAA family ATPase [Parapedobacter indicus]PPL02281.1 putative ATP-dependent endonuclease of OLD family [Parapedobacter indicus]SFI51082.1 Predicted ATP-dependent endonuclease of the OLD family, contains P-loop ATPase and TOPRIM domains [Parapedobacter indicus]
MRISTLKIKGYKSFGPKEVIIPLQDKLAAFIGLNSAGKTSALEALKKLFGSSLSEREIYRQDFHIGKDENSDEITERALSIEVRIDFSEDEQEAVPHFFSNMVVDELLGDLYIRIRLEATWKKSDLIPQGEIEVKTYFIKTPEYEPDQEDNKQPFPNHFRTLIQVLYVPAIRRPAEQLRYASGSILYRVLRKIKWGDDLKETFVKKIGEINDAFKDLSEFGTVQTSITEFWQKFHKDERYRDTNFSFGGSDFDAILKKLEISFSPTGTHKPFGIDELGEGYRSLFYMTLVCSLLDIEEKMAEEEDETIGVTRPLLTILAIEEPENHIAPQLLGRVIKILKTIAEKENSQVLLSSHTPAIIKRLDPEYILHFRITEDYETEVNPIFLPDKADEAYKYVKEAVRNYPEIYFARLVVIGEGDSEEVIFNRLMDVMKVDFDDNIITFAPLGHRFVNHIWKLLEALHIPYITLLDLDIEREGGGWGRVKYALQKLIQIGLEKNEVLMTSGDSVLSDEEFEKMHTWGVNKDDDTLGGWIDYLKEHNIFYSFPLDLDFLMLIHYPEFYKKAIPKGGGPRIPDKDAEPEEFEEKVNSAVQATLKSEKAIGETYSDEEKELMIWYNYHFLGRGKPTTHIQVLSLMSDEEIKSNLPSVFKEIFDRISSILETN